jgi:hypothetical protein
MLHLAFARGSHVCAETSHSFQQAPGQQGLRLDHNGQVYLRLWPNTAAASRVIRIRDGLYLGIDGST